MLMVSSYDGCGGQHHRTYTDFTVANHEAGEARARGLVVKVFAWDYTAFFSQSPWKLIG